MMNNKVYSNMLVFSGFLWAINGIVLSIITNLNIYENSGVRISFFSPIIFAGLNDLFAGILLLFFNVVSGKIREIYEVLKTKNGKIIIFAALIGGPIGQCMYLMGLSMAPVSYVMPVSALCPVFGMILSSFILKERINLKTKVLILGCVIGTVILSYTKPIGNYPKFYFGILFSLLSALSWGIEATLITFCTKGDVDEKIALNIREIVSGSFILFIILPLLRIFDSVFIVINNKVAILYLFFAGLFAVLSYSFFYKGMKVLGVSKGMALNSTFSMWAVVLSVIFLSVPLTLNLLFGSIIVTGCVICLTLNN